MKSEVLLGVVTAAVVVLWIKEYKRSKKKCGCTDKAKTDTATTTTTSTAADTTKPVVELSADQAAKVLAMDGKRWVI